MLDLSDYFSRVAVINLDRDESRWEFFCQQMAERGVCGFERYSAVDARLGGIPPWWRGPQGAWGCYLSHLRIAQDFLYSGQRGSFLVFEDDCLLAEDFAGRFRLIMEEVGDDYDMLYFGGQHYHRRVRPWRESHLSTVIRATNLNRTHCFAVQGDFVPHYLRHLLEVRIFLDRLVPCHIDHQLGLLHDPLRPEYGGEPRILAACPWICGQDASVSRVSGKTIKKQFWWQISESRIANRCLEPPPRKS